MRSLVCLAILLVTTTASADADRCAPAQKQDVNFHVEHRGGQRVMVIDAAIVVCGHPPRPSVAYVLTAKSINYEWEQLAQDFLPHVLASVAKAPF